MLIKRTVLGAMAAAAIGWAVPVYACDPAKPRCGRIMELMDRIGYLEKLQNLQMECRGRATQMDPENLRKSKPGMLRGLVENTGSWSQLHKAFDMYVDEACGGNEIIGLMIGGYRHAWDSQLPGDELERKLEQVKSKGPAAIDADISVVRARMNEVIRPLLQATAVYAETRYEARIKGIITGEALEVSESSMCTGGLTNDLTPLSSRVLGAPAVLRAPKN